MYAVFSNGNGASLNANYYWSSTELDYENAARVVFYFGGQGYGDKFSLMSVRAVRAF